MAIFLYISLLLLQAYLLGSDVKSLLSQGLEEISVSIGCEFGNLGRGEENMQWGPKWDHYSLGPFPLGNLREYNDNWNCVKIQDQPDHRWVFCRLAVDWRQEFKGGHGFHMVSPFKRNGIWANHVVTSRRDRALESCFGSGELSQYSRTIFRLVNYSNLPRWESLIYTLS